MNQQQRDSILQAAISHYGEQHQLLKCAEEACEFARAIVRFVANPCEETIFDLIDEGADMEVSSVTVGIIVPKFKANIKGRVEYKIDRLADMVAVEKCNG